MPDTSKEFESIVQYINEMAAGIRMEEEESDHWYHIRHDYDSQSLEQILDEENIPRRMMLIPPPTKERGRHRQYLLAKKRKAKEKEAPRQWER